LASETNPSSPDTLLEEPDGNRSARSTASMILP
jgi:hypothetical protein